MLKHLYIKNYALIDSLEIDFNSGFSVITGETGAGKSIILGALSLVLGQRADIKAIKAGENKCIIEGVFDVSEYDLKDFCEEHDLEYDEHSYILRREILSTGKSRSFINDSPVSLTDLKDLGTQLIDVHSQHKNLLLGDDRFQMQVLDTLSGTQGLLKEYEGVYKNCKKTEKKLSDLVELSNRSKSDEEYLRFQYNALAEAALIDGEQEELEKELDLLNHSEDIKTALFKIYSSLSDDEFGVVQKLKEGVTIAGSLQSIYPKSEEILDRLNAAYVDLKDLSPEIERYAEDIEFNPERLAIVQARLDLIYNLQQKHRVGSVSELLAIYKELEAKIDSIDSFDSQIEVLQKELAQQEAQVMSLATKLSDKRKLATKNIEKQLTDKVSTLGMPNVRFECQMQKRDHPDLTGIDNLEFMFSANKNIPLQPVSEVASGGEISRVMLCLKSMIAGATALPTIIFDEIDTGVSGDVADKMGLIMQEFGQQMQVIAITHLPQIAAKGKAHYFVYKADDETSVSTNLRQLTEEERVKELAQMLSGAQITEAAIENAKIMLRESGN